MPSFRAMGGKVHSVDLVPSKDKKSLQNVRLYRTLKGDDYSLCAPPGFKAPHRKQSNQRPAARPGEQGTEYHHRADCGGRYANVSGRGPTGMAGASTRRRPKGHLERVYLRQLADHV